MASSPAPLPPIDALFDDYRLKRPFGFRHFLLVIYFPIGLVLCVLRLFLAGLITMLAVILPKNHTVSWLLTQSIGLAACIFVRIHNMERFRSEEPKIIVANHVSNLDGLFARYLCPVSCVLHEKYSRVFGLNRLVRSFLEPVYVGADKEAVRLQIHHVIQRNGDPLFIMPEGGVSNGRVGIMNFQKFVFGLGVPIHPVGLRIRDNFFPVELDTLSASFLWNIFWFCFLPYHILDIHCLPVMRMDPSGNEDAPMFAKRVQIRIAKELNIAATPYFYADKLEWIHARNSAVNES